MPTLHLPRTLCLTLSLALAAFHACATELNTANRAELEQVKGIGPQLAADLLEARARGAYADWPDVLRRIRGLGPVKARRLSQGGLTVNGLVYLEKAASQP